MSTPMAEQFYVASRAPGQAHAALVDDEKTDKGSVRAFYHLHAGCTITKVGRDEMERMLRAYIRERDEVKS